MARQWFSVHLNHVQIATDLARSLSRAAITAWGLTYECILMIRLCSNVSSEMFVTSNGFLHSSSNGLKRRIFWCTKGDECLERIRFTCSTFVAPVHSTLPPISPQGAKVFYLSGLIHGQYPKVEVHNLSRFISIMKFRVSL